MNIASYFQDLGVIAINVLFGNESMMREYFLIFINYTQGKVEIGSAGKVEAQYIFFPFFLLNSFFN